MTTCSGELPRVLFLLILEIAQYKTSEFCWARDTIISVGIMQEVMKSMRIALASWHFIQSAREM